LHLPFIWFLAQKLTGNTLQWTQFGKPEKVTYDFAMNVLHRQQTLLWSSHHSKVTPLQKIYGIGDNPASDIEGANRAGITSVLVKTGVYAGGDHEAHHLVEDVEEAVDKILKEVHL
jgi:ribonucleotide monophosphatase NagD (HAD superfamily)